MSLVDAAGLYIGNRRCSEDLAWLTEQGISLVVSAGALSPLLSSLSLPGGCIYPLRILRRFRPTSCFL